MPKQLFLYATIIILLFNPIGTNKTTAASHNNIETTVNGWTPLARALDEGRFHDAKKLLKAEPEPSFRGNPMIVAFVDDGDNSTEIIRFLIKNKVNKKYYDKAFLTAAYNNKLDIIELLLAAGANINATIEDKNALAITNNELVAKFLLKKGIKTKDKNIYPYVWYRFPVLKAIVNVKKTTPNVPQDIADKGLIAAARIGDDWAVNYFITKGANINAVTEDKSNDDYYDDKLSKSTALIENAFQGYPYASYDKENQVSTQVAEALIKAGANLDQKDLNGRTALHYACGNQWTRVMIWPIPMGTRQEQEMGMHGDPASPPAQNNDEIAELLIRSGADLNIADALNGDTPLLLAAKNNRIQCMRALLRAGAKTDIKDKDGKTVFNHAKTEEALAVLKDAGFKLSQEQLDEALRELVDGCSYTLDMNAVSKLVDQGADPNLRIEETGEKRLLHYIIERALGWSYSTFDFLPLINLGVDVNVKDSNGRTPLMYVSQNREGARKEYAELLLAHGANLEAKDYNSMTALTIARAEGNKAVEELLVEKGAKRDMVGEWWHTVYQIWMSDQVALLQKLVNEGANVNQQTTHPIFDNSSHMIKGEGTTALMHAAKWGNVAFMKGLINMGADIHIRDKRGMTFFHHTTKFSTLPDGTYYSSGAKYNKTQATNIYALMQEVGADINAKDNTGKTVYDYCIRFDEVELAKVIEENAKK